MKRKSLLSLMLLCFAFFGVARAEVVEIGSGTTGNSYLPTYSFYNYSLTQQIYPACEIGTAGTINSIAFHNVGTSAKTRTLDVYFVLTDKSSFSGATDWITVTASDLVYSGSVTFPASDWVTLTLNTPFTLDGTNNLAVIVDDNTGSYSSGLSCATFDASGMAIRVYSDGTNYDPLAPTSYTGTVMNVKNCIRLDITPDPSVTLCCPPDAITVPTEGITAHEAVVNWEGGAAPYNVEYKKTTDTEWTVGATGVTGLTTTLTGLTQNTTYQARVQSGCGSAWVTSTNFTTLVSVQTPTDLTCTGTTTNSATLSWTENGTATSWVVAYKAAGEENFTEVTVNTNPPYTLTGLTAATTYTAKVCAVVNGERSSWSSTISFITACDTYTAPYEYGFEDAGPFTCWTPFNTGTARSTSYPHGGSYSLRFSGTTSNLIALPQFTNATNTLALDFWTRPESETNSNCGTFDVGYMTDLEDATSFVAIETYSYNDWASATYLEKYVPLNTAPADAYIAFRHNAGATNWYWFVDDISVIEIPDCAKPTGLAASNPFGHGATLRWISEASEWVVAYKTAEAENFTEITGVTENPYTIDGLDPETDYIAKVRANCDGTLSDWSSAVSFTTTVACVAPSALTVTLTPGDGTVAALSWTENGTATEWDLEFSIDAAFADFRVVNVANTPSTTLEGLTPEITYYARVKTYCGGEDGYSEYSNIVTFTPTDRYFLTVNNGTTTNSYVPVHGLWADSHSKSQFIIPADGLADMQWGIINKMTFHASTASTDWGAAMFEVYVTEVSYTAFETASLVDWTSMTKVMNAGSLAISGNKMEVTLDTPYQYMGGNLLIGILETTPGTYQSCSWYGVSSENNVALGGYESSKAISFQTFLPKTTFEYTPGEAPDCIPPTGLAVDYTGGTTATVSWTSDATAWNIDVNGTVTAITENPYTLTGLELATTYKVKVQADCDGSTSDWSNVVSFTTDLCLPEDMCEITFELTDSYGDTWNGNAIQVVDVLTGAVIGTMTNDYNNYEATGSSGSYTQTKTLAVCDGRQLEFSWVSGSYPGETSYVVSDLNGVIFEGSGAMSEPITYNMSCSLNPCRKPIDLTSTPYVNSAELGWNHDLESYNIRYREAGDAAGINWDSFAQVGSNKTATSEWVEYTFDLSAYAGQQGHVAIRHYNCTDNYVLLVDDVTYGGTTYNFDDGNLPEGWLNIDKDGDEFIWEVYDLTFGADSSYAHSGDYGLWSASYDNDTYTALTPDNWVILPYGDLSGTLSFYAKGLDPSYASEVFGVFVTTEEINLGETPWIEVNNVSGLNYELTGLNAKTSYEWQVQGVNCDGDGATTEWSDLDTFTTADYCDVPFNVDLAELTATSATFIWEGYQESYNVRYRIAAQYDEIFNDDFYENSHGDFTTYNAGSESGYYWGDSQHTFAVYQFAADTTLTDPQYLISYEMDSVMEGTVLEFIAYVNSAYPETYSVGFSSTDDELESFTWGEETIVSQSSYQEVDVPLGSKYFAIKYISNNYYMAVTSFFAYANYVAPGDWVELTGVTSPVTLSPLTPETEYEVYVQGMDHNCSEGTEWVGGHFFTPEQTNLTQTVSLIAGTNWFSTYVEITLEDLQAALDAVNTNNKAITIKAQNASSNYIPRTHKWNTNASFTWDVANMYQIVMTEACEITLEGAPIDPTEHEITIAGGGVATWIGFPFSESMTLTNAFAALPPTNGDVVRYQSLNAAYARNRWTTGIVNLEPGKGYIYVSAASAGDRTLVFPTDTKRAANWNGFNLNVKNTAKDTPYRIVKKAIKGVAKTVDETLTEIIK